MPTRLEEHRRTFRELNGVGPLLKVDELDREELALVNGDFLLRCGGHAGDITAIYAAYVQTLHSWGIMCPHPQHHRTYGNLKRESDVPLLFSEEPWFTCRLCASAVINRP